MGIAKLIYKNKKISYTAAGENILKKIETGQAKVLPLEINTSLPWLY
jgi:hypothetical protein